MKKIAAEVRKDSISASTSTFQVSRRRATPMINTIEH